MTQKEPARRASGYLPTLDGWRCLAIVSVILFHGGLHRIGFLSTAWFVSYGATGVDVFFAISGVLICSRLLEEEHYYGSISLKNFYIRRFFRILPAAITYLLVITFLGLLGIIAVTPREPLFSILFLRNYPRLWTGGVPAGWFTAHFWSLAVEEHFYLLLPALLVIVPRYARLGMLFLLALLLAGCRFAMLQHHPAELVLFHSEVRLDQLFSAAAIAVLLREYEFRWRISAFLKFWPVLTLLALAAIVWVQSPAWQKTCLAILLPLVVAGSTLHSRNAGGRFLESPPVKFIGKISYSLYLWQQLFFTFGETGRTPLGALERFPLNYLATFSCALLSFYLIEKPLVKAGHRWAPPATPGR